MSPMRLTLIASVVLGVGCQQPPEISDLVVVAEDFTAGIAFLAEDPNGDLDGGKVFLDFGDNKHVEYALTSDDPAEERRGTIVALGYRYPACDVDRSTTVSVTVADAEGGISNPVMTTVSLKGDVTDESEPNDDETQVDRFTYSASSPAAICGELDRTGLDSDDFYREGDMFEIYPLSSGHKTVVLQTPADATFDLWTFDLMADDFNMQSAFGEDVDAVQGFRWITLDVTLHAGEPLYVYAGAASGPTGEYSLFIE